MKQARFNISLDKTGDKPITVNYSTENGTAISPTFYTASSGTLTFVPGEFTKSLIIPLTATSPSNVVTSFNVRITSPTNATLNTPAFGSVSIPAGAQATPWLDRFNFSYNLLKDTDNGYFGPPTGPKAFEIPYHAKERAIIVEAPDWTHTSVSEAASFWVKMEAWQTILTGNTVGLEKAWASIDNNWIPSAVDQPWGAYNYANPAAYIPDALTLQSTPLAAPLLVAGATTSAAIVAGADPLYSALNTAYGTKSMYLMHWYIDVDGDYGFKNPDGTKTGVFINNYERGPVEDGLATITHPSFDDFNNGGGMPYGWLPIYGRSIDVYPDGDSNSYGKHATYSMAGDADVRAVGNIHQTIALASTTVSTTLKAKASKMSDYIRYTLYDKYFKAIPGNDGSGCHFLLSWGCGFGLGVPQTTGGLAQWGFRIGNSEIHHGYNGIDVAYAARTGGDLNPLAVGATAAWSTSLDRQLELLRWLQSPEGPIAGGVSSSWRGRYEIPVDGRQNAKFYGLYYNYSPSWFNPPSNNWPGYQAWGLDRVASVYIHSSSKSDTENNSISYRCGVILDKFIPWFFNNCQVNLKTNTLSYPDGLSWVSNSKIAGKTTTQPAAKFTGLPVNPPISGASGGPGTDGAAGASNSDVFEYLPSKEWPGTNPDYTAFWANDGSVPNPNLHCTITGSGWDHGTASGFAQVLIQYCQAKKIINNSLAGSIPNTSILYSDVLQKATDMLEFIWNNKDDDGFGSTSELNLARLDDILWVPPEFGTGHMPNGEVIANGQTTFASARASLYETTPEWPALRAWLDSDKTGPAPSVTYHRFWNGTEVAVAFAMLHKFFPTSQPTTS